MPVESWQGSENHNWGSKHTDEYAWGQVAGFDAHPDTFLEAITARIRLGPFWSPWLTLACLRHAGRNYNFNRLGQALSASSSIRFGGDQDFTWEFLAGKGDERLKVVIAAPRRHFIGLNYYNPPGGSHTCLNSKIARCTLHLVSPDESVELVTMHRAAFEILTDRQDHGVPVMA